MPLAPQDNAIPFLVASQVGVATGIVLYNVTAISLMQALTPPRLLGRMNASRRWIVWGTIPLGSLTGGVLASTIGLRETLFAGSIASCFCFLFLLAEPLRTIKALPDPDEPPVEEELVELPLEAQRARSLTTLTACPSCLRSRPGCGASTRSCPPRRCFGPGRRTSRR